MRGRVRKYAPIDAVKAAASAKRSDPRSFLRKMGGDVMTTTVSNETKRALKKRKPWGAGEVKRHLTFLTMLLPGLAYMICFSYLPMPAIVVAFQNYKLSMPPADSFI